MLDITSPPEHQIAYNIYQRVCVEMCGQVSDRAASRHRAALSCLFPVHRVRVDAQTSVPADRHRKHWHRHS